jgi:hypothetical protein
MIISSAFSARKLVMYMCLTESLISACDNNRPPEILKPLPNTRDLASITSTTHGPFNCPTRCCSLLHHIKIYIIFPQSVDCVSYRKLFFAIFSSPSIVRPSIELQSVYSKSLPLEFRLTRSNSDITTQLHHLKAFQLLLFDLLTFINRDNHFLCLVYSYLNSFFHSFICILTRSRRAWERYKHYSDQMQRMTSCEMHR